jgi:hypothetical protein
VSLAALANSARVRSDSMPRLKSLIRELVLVPERRSGRHPWARS